VSRLEALAESRRMIDDPTGVLQAHTQRLGPTYRYAFGGAREPGRVPARWQVGETSAF